MDAYKFILDLAIILLSTKVLGLVSKKFKMPQVVGALVAGLVLGPAALNVVSETTFIHETAEIGVIILMFCAGLETDIDELRKCGKAAFVIAILGVALPLAGGFIISKIFLDSGMIESDISATNLLQSIFVGVVLTATSVSITVETLKEMGKLKTRSGNAILGAAIIDDIIGIICLTVVTSMADDSVKISLVLVKIIGFFIFAGVVGVVFYKFYSKWTEKADRGMHRHAIVAMVFCLLMAYIAEGIFGVADITGAFIAGLIISSTIRTQYVASKFDVVSYMYLSPIFFASIGLKVELNEINSTIIIFALIMVVVAIMTKVVGCGLGAKLTGYKNYQSIRIGIGMVSRGEVALIVASKGEEMDLISTTMLAPIVIVVVVTTIITPIMLKPAFSRGPVNTDLGVFVSHAEELENIRAGNEHTGT